MKTRVSIRKEKDGYHTIIRTIFLDVMGNNPRNKIFETLIVGREFGYTKRDIARCSEITMKKVNQELPKLLRLGIVKRTKKLGREWLHKLDFDNELTIMIFKFYRELMSKYGIDKTGRAVFVYNPKLVKKYKKRKDLEVKI